jgi:hypothetical protein
MTKEGKYKAFVDAIGRITLKNHSVEFLGEFSTFVLVVPGIGHYHCIDDNNFPVGATNWLNSLDVGKVHELNDEDVEV